MKSRVKGNDIEKEIITDANKQKNNQYSLGQEILPAKMVIKRA